MLSYNLNSSKEETKDTTDNRPDSEISKNKNSVKESENTLRNRVSNDEYEFMDFFNVSHLSHLSHSTNEDFNLYVILIDGVPEYYLKNEEKASELLSAISRKYSQKYFLKGWNTDIIIINKNEVHITGNYKFFLINYDQILHSISYRKIEEYI